MCGDGRAQRVVAIQTQRIASVDVACFAERANDLGMIRQRVQHVATLRSKRIDDRWFFLGVQIPLFVISVRLLLGVLA